MYNSHRCYWENIKQSNTRIKVTKVFLFLTKFKNEMVAVEILTCTIVLWDWLGLQCTSWPCVLDTQGILCLREHPSRMALGLQEKDAWIGRLDLQRSVDWRQYGISSGNKKQGILLNWCIFIVIVYIPGKCKTIWSGNKWSGALHHTAEYSSTLVTAVIQKQLCWQYKRIHWGFQWDAFTKCSTIIMEEQPVSRC